MREDNGEISDYTFEEVAALTAERDRYKAALEKIAAGIMFPAAVAHAALKDMR